MHYYIIGSTGYIGQYLLNSLSKTDYVFGTCRETMERNGQMIYYDMSVNKASLRLPNPFIGVTNKTAVICAGVSKISECHQNYGNAYRINVVNTKQTISQLVEYGYYVIFLSTDNVFDGEKGYYVESDLVNPINDYGRMKSEVEGFLRKEYPEVCILRLSKVVGIPGLKGDLFTDWKIRALSGKPIRCIADNYMTPLFVGDIVKKVQTLSTINYGGLLHLGGPERLSRIDLCNRFMDSLGVRYSIDECSVSDISDTSEGWPLDTSLISDRMIEICGESSQIDNVFKLYKL